MVSAGVLPDDGVPLLGRPLRSTAWLRSTEITSSAADGLGFVSVGEGGVRPVAEPGLGHVVGVDPHARVQCTSWTQ